MPKFTLTAEWDDDLKVTHTFNQEFLDDVVLQLDQFLRGCGFFYEGELAINDNVDVVNDTIDFDFGKFETMNSSMGYTFTDDTITITTGT